MLPREACYSDDIRMLLRCYPDDTKSDDTATGPSDEYKVWARIILVEWSGYKVQTFGSDFRFSCSCKVVSQINSIRVTRPECSDTRFASSLHIFASFRFLFTSFVWIVRSLRSVCIVQLLRSVASFSYIFQLHRLLAFLCTVSSLGSIASFASSAPASSPALAISSIELASRPNTRLPGPCAPDARIGSLWRSGKS